MLLVNIKNYLSFAASVYRLGVWICAVRLTLLITNIGFCLQQPSKEDDVLQLDEIVVTGSKTEQVIANSTTLVQVISRDEVERLGAENLGQVLEHYAGLVITRDAHGDGIQIQGLDPEYVLILIDGQPQIGRIAGKLDLARIMVENIDRIEVVKGASSALFGSRAMGGVVNIITRSGGNPLRLSLNNSFQLNKVMNNRGTLEFAEDRLNASLAISHNQAAPQDINPSDKTTTIDGYRNLNFSSRLNWDLTSKTTLLLTSQYLKQHQNGISSFDDGWYDRTGELDNYNLQAKVNCQVFSVSQLSATVYQTQYQDVSVTTTQPQNTISATNKTVQYLTKGELLFETRFSPQTQLTLGMESTFENLSSQRIQGGKKQLRNSSTFAQHQWDIWPQFTVVIGSRLDHHSEFGTYLTPKLNTKLNLGRLIQMRASWGRGFRAPTFQNLYLNFTNTTAGYQVLGNPRLEPEFSSSWNLSFTSHWLNRYQGQVHFYRNDLTNLIEAEVIGESAIGGRKYQYKNVNSAFTTGIDSSVSAQFFNGLNLQLGHALLIAKNKETTLDLLGRSRHTFHLEVGYQYQPFDLLMDVRVRHANRWGLYDDGDNILEGEEYAPGYWIWSCRGRKKLGRSWQGNAGINNLFNFKSPQFYTYVGRIFYVGVSFVH
ncbi:hypothetical protein CMK22_09765 [Candidatus Poribacteria bacterium]|nr:hypothetical protein [Candidatus Poribacteria bacterium]